MGKTYLSREAYLLYISTGRRLMRRPRSKRTYKLDELYRCQMLDEQFVPKACARWRDVPSSWDDIQPQICYRNAELEYKQKATGLEARLNKLGWLLLSVPLSTKVDYKGSPIKPYVLDLGRQGNRKVLAVKLPRCGKWARRCTRKGWLLVAEHNFSVAELLDLA
jgi:hypothetical protein